MNHNSFLGEMLSEYDPTGKSRISSKRVVGFMLMVICMGCTIYLVIKEGGTVIVENLLQTALVMGASLLGISSITGIWKNGSMTVGEQQSHKNLHDKQSTIICPYHNTEKGTD